jgi:hypothetical protein
MPAATRQPSARKTTCFSRSTSTQQHKAVHQEQTIQGTYPDHPVPAGRISLFTMSNNTQGHTLHRAARKTCLFLGSCRSRHQTPALQSRLTPNPCTPGGARRDRTDDLMLAKHALSQLSYGPANPKKGRAPGTSSQLTSRRPVQVSLLQANRLADHPAIHPSGAEPSSWWAWEDLNFRPHAYQARALTN